VTSATQGRHRRREAAARPAKCAGAGLFAACAACFMNALLLSSTSPLPGRSLPSCISPSRTAMGGEPRRAPLRRVPALGGRPPTCFGAAWRFFMPCWLCSPRPGRSGSSCALSDHRHFSDHQIFVVQVLCSACASPPLWSISCEQCSEGGRKRGAQQALGHLGAAIGATGRRRRAVSALPPGTRAGPYIFYPESPSSGRVPAARRLLPQAAVRRPRSATTHPGPYRTGASVMALRRSRMLRPWMGSRTYLPCLAAGGPASPRSGSFEAIAEHRC